MAAHEQAEPAGAHYDAVVIGTSPLVLIEALFLAYQGHRVVLVEQRDRVGGAWYTMPLWEFESVQPGCHYIERRPKAYAFLEQTLGLELVPQTFDAVWYDMDRSGRKRQRRPSRPVWWLRQRLLHAKFLSDDGWGMIKAIRRRDVSKFGRAVRRKLTAPPYRYPAGGSRAMLDALMRRVEASSIDLRLGTRVGDVELGDGERLTRCNIGGKPCQTRKLVVGRHVVPLLPIAGQAPPAEPEYLVNVVLRIAGRKSTPFDYIEIHRDELINRVHDITGFAVPRPAESELLICCNLTGPGPIDLPVDPQAVVDHLIRCGLLSADARLTASQVERYPNPRTSRTRSTDALTIVDTYDLGVTMHRNADRWRPYFER